MTLHPMRDALAAVSTNPALLDGFGLERVSLAPTLWHESLTIDGRGNAAIRTLRSITDASGEAIGEFRSPVDPGQILRLVKVLHDTDFSAMRPSLVHALEMRLELSILIDGMRKDVVIALSDPAASTVVQPLLRELDRIAMVVRRTHVATLALTLAAPERVPVGQAPLRLQVTFHNQGVMGAWVTDPSSLAAGQSEHEKMALLYSAVPIQEPHVAILPATIEEAVLQPVEPAPRPLLWLAAGAKVAREFVAAPSLGMPRPHCLRAQYSSYAGSDVIAGRKRLRGAAFSNLLQVAVG